MNPPDGTSTVGITGVPVLSIGYLLCNIYFGNNFYRNIKVHVYESASTPTLIGLNVIKHDTNEDVTFGRDKVVFHRKILSTSFNHVAPCVQPPSNAFAGKHQLHSLEDKIEWLQTQKSVTVPTDHGDKGELAKLTDLLLKYNDVFGCEGNELGEFPHDVEIPTTGEAMNRKQHPIPERYVSVIDQEIDRMLQQGVIEPCDDPKGFNTPMMVVDKKNGEPRVVANFKHTLNKVLASNADWCWQMPATETAINAIGSGNQYFSSLDLKSGYWQCRIKQSDRHKTAFHWKNKCYMYTRLPFGLAVSGMIFSRCIAKALEQVSNVSNIQSYIDDVLCYAKDIDTYLDTLEQVLKAAQQNGIKLNPKKCTFLQQKVKFLGRIINKDGFTADPEYVEAIRHLPPPTNRRELQAVIGRIVWLRHFVETRVGERVRLNNFSHLLKELNLLNRKDKKFEWTDKAEIAFKKVKTRLCTSPVIHFADFEKEFILVTDASQIACGAVLLQEHDGKAFPVAVASSTLNPTQQKWSATEREAYGVIWAVEKFEYFLRGRPFIIRTDHKSLTFLDRTHFSNEKISRWQDRLAQYQFVVQYIEGEQNVFADLLSRPCGVTKEKLPETSEVAGKVYKIGETRLRVYVPSWCSLPVKSLKLSSSEQEVSISHCFTAKSVLDDEKAGTEWAESIKIGTVQRDDPFLSKVILNLEGKYEKGLEHIMDESDHRGKIYKRFASRFKLDPVTGILMYHYKEHTQIVVPRSLYPYFLYQAHNENGHFGRDRMVKFLHDYWWPCKLADITNYDNSCVSCCMRKGNYNRSAKPDIGHLLRGTKPFEVLYCDFVHMPKSRCGKKYILTVQCAFTRYFIAIPTCRDRAIDAAQALVKEVILKFNCRPKTLSSDRGTHFTGSVMEETCRLMGIDHKLHTAWRPQSSGNIERAHRTLKNALFTTCAEKRCDWAESLPYCVSAMNLAHNKATGVSPHRAVFGTMPDLGLPKIPGKELRCTEPLSYGLTVRHMLDRIHQLVTISAEAADLSLEKRVNKGGTVQKIAIGDMVYVKRERSVVAVRSKLNWIGTYRVIDTNDLIIRISDDKDNTDWVHRHHVLRHEPRKPELEHDAALPIPPAIPFDSGDFENLSVNPSEASKRQTRGPKKSSNVTRKPNVTADENVVTSSFVRRSVRAHKPPTRYTDQPNRRPSQK